MKKTFKEIIIILLVTFIITGCGKKNNLVKCESDLLGYDFSNYVLNSNGNAKEDYADITFEIKSSKVDSFKKGITKVVSLFSEEDFNTISGTNLHKEITDFCNREDIIEMYHTFRTGKKVKTRDIYMTLCKKNSKYYLNIIG